MANDHSCGTDNRIHTELTNSPVDHPVKGWTKWGTCMWHYIWKEKEIVPSCILQHNEITKILSWEKEAGTNDRVFYDYTFIWGVGCTVYQKSHVTCCTLVPGHSTSMSVLAPMNLSCLCTSLFWMVDFCVWSPHWLHIPVGGWHTMELCDSSIMQHIAVLSVYTDKQGPPCLSTKSGKKYAKVWAQEGRYIGPQWVCEAGGL